MPIIYFAMNLYGIYLRKLSRKAHMLEDITNFIASEVNIITHYLIFLYYIIVYNHSTNIELNIYIYNIISLLIFIWFLKI